MYPPPQQGASPKIVQHMGLGPGQGLLVQDLTAKEIVQPMAPPSGGANTAARGSQGLAPMAPPNLGFILVSFTGKFTNILGLVGW